MPFALRVAISLALLAIIVLQVEWEGVFAALTRADLGWLGVAMLAFNGSMLLASRRWQLIVGTSRRGGASVTGRAAVSATYVSLWLSNFLPTAFGGDVARVVAARRAGTRMPVALSSVFLDRYLGLTTLALLFFLVEGLQAVMGETRPLLLAAAALAAGFSTLLVIVWAGSHVALSRRLLRKGAVRFIARATALLRDLGSNRKASVRVVTASVVATILGAMAYWGAIRCVIPTASFPTALAVAAAGTLASALPISLSGWGVREGAVAVTVSQLSGLSPSDASLVAVLNAVVIGATSLIGFAVALAAGSGWRLGGRDGIVGQSVPRADSEV